MTPEPALTFDCPSCGQNLSAPPNLYGTTIECPACLSSLLVPIPQHPATLSAPAVLVPATLPKLWNPETAATLCILATPVFGPVIHGLNWKALGRPDEASTSFKWAWGFAAFVLLWMLGVGLVDPAFEQYVIPVGVVAFFVQVLPWYFIAAKKQIQFLKDTFGGAYPKRSLFPPVLLALVIVAVLVVATTVWVPARSTESDASETRQSFSAVTPLPPRLDLEPREAVLSAHAPILNKEGGGVIGRTAADGPPDFWVRGAAETMNSDFGGKPFKRGEVLQSFGNPGVPAGTLIYPIQIDGFPLPIYMSKDSFGSWQFTIGDEPRLFKALEPATPEERLKREADQRLSDQQAKEGRESATAYLKAREEEGKRNREKLEAGRKRPAGTNLSQDRSEESSVRGRVATAKSDLAALEVRMNSERKRYSDSLAVINTETANKTRAVTQGSPAYYRCAEASKVIQEVEAKAPEMKAEKARLEELIKALETEQ